jgi:hypothetical protein
MMTAIEFATLTDAVLNCTPLLDPGERRALIEQLPNPTSIAWNDVPMTHAFMIVRHCATTPHGFDRLIDALAPYPKLDRLLEILSQYRPQTISFADVFDLKKRLRGATRIDEARVLQVAAKFLQDSLDFPPHEDVLIWTIEELAKATTTAQQHKLLQFLSLLRPQLPREIRDSVDAWLTRVAAAYRLQLHASDSGSDNEYSAPHLMIVVKARPGTESYLLSAYLVKAEARSLGSWEVPEFVDCQKYMDGICYDALKRLRAEPDKAARMIIEVFLPDNLLACDIDRWMSRLGGDRLRPLGVELPVAVRSASRVYDAARYGSKVRLLWMRKWRQRTKPPSPLLASEVYIADSRSELADLFDRLEDDYLAFGSAIHVSYESAPEALRDIIDSGVPVAIWPRCERKGDVKADADLVRRTLCSTALNEVPASVFQSRKQAFRNKETESIFCDLVLLWDDPELIPADSPLLLSERD